MRQQQQSAGAAQELAGIDVERARAETPGCEDIVHFNNAGAALQPAVVLETVISHLLREAEIGGYEAADEALERRETVYRSIARLLGAAPDEVAIVENATRAFDLAFHSVPLQDGDVVLTSMPEYHSNYIAYLRAARDRRLTIRVLPNDASGQISLDALAREVQDPRVRLVSISHVPTQSGLVQPAAGVGRLARQAGVWYLLDATQSAGQIPLEVHELGVDLLATTGRKYLRGPRGVGFLYARRDRIPELHPPFVDGHAARWERPDAYVLREDARRFENWESNQALVLGLGAAVDYALALGIGPIWQRVQRLADSLREQLAALPGVRIRDEGAVRCGIVSFTVDGLDTAAIKERLAARPRRINVTTSSVYSSLLDMTARGLSSTVRASVHYYNTNAELDEFVQALAALR